MTDTRQTTSRVAPGRWHDGAGTPESAQVSVGRAWPAEAAEATEDEGGPDAAAGEERMPALLRGRRRWLMVLLVLVALANSGFTVASGLLVGRLVGQVGAPTPQIVGTLCYLFSALLGLGVTRYGDRVLAERLGQDYVQEIRLGLIDHAMTASRTPSLGITIARSTNDLSSVRNWVSMGIAPLVAFVPLAVGALIALAVLDPRLALGVGIPLVLLGVTLAVISKTAFERARLLRKRRGTLAARVADTVTAATGVSAAGGVDRELRAMDRTGLKMVSAAVSRARTAGVMRAVAMVVPVLGSAATAGMGALGIVSVASVAVALTIAGILTSPIGELGKVVEYRQNYKAARRIIAPLLAPRGGRTGEPVADPAESEGGRVLVRGLVAGGRPVPELVAEPDDRIVLQGASAGEEQEVFSALALPQADGVASVRVDGKDLAHTGPKNRRRRVGYAPRGARLERGPISRAVRYRRPDLSGEAGERALETVGLAGAVAGLPEGAGTVLRRGGEPLNGREVARLWVARAIVGTPPLLLLEHIDDDLGAAGTEMLRGLLADYPGVVILATDAPEALLADWRSWGPLPRESVAEPTAGESCSVTPAS